MKTRIYFAICLSFLFSFPCYSFFEEACQKLLAQEIEKIHSAPIPLGLGSHFNPTEPDTSYWLAEDADPATVAQHDKDWLSNQVPLITPQLSPSNPIEFAYQTFFDHMGQEVPSWFERHQVKDLVHAFTFAGYSISFQDLERSRGKLPRFLMPHSSSSEKTRCESLSTMPDLLNPLDHRHNSYHGTYWSTSRSIRVARDFGWPRTGSNGFIYMIYVDGGFDTKNLPNNGLEIEQEIMLPGSLLWNHVVAYRPLDFIDERKSILEFIGPIYIREGLADREPEAFKQAMKAFSRRSPQSESLIKTKRMSVSPSASAPTSKRFRK